MLELKNIDKYYNVGTVNEMCLFNDFNFTVNDGEFVSVVGSNGSGKTSMLNLICGSTYVDGGRIIMNGEDITNKKEFLRYNDIGRVYQNPSMGTCPDMTILKNMALADNKAKSYGLSLGINKKRIEYYKEQLSTLNLGLEDKLHIKVGVLSGGQRQRLTIARALVGEPEILILDEATSALDVSVQQTIIELIVKLQKEKNITIGFICHDISLIQSCAHEVAVMYLGNVVEVLPAKNLSERAVHPYTRALIGSIFDIGMDFGKPIEEIKGEAPSPLDVPAGCPFRGRCPKATEKCAAEKPKLHQIGADHEVACHLFDKEDK